jgi:hypothetical protein
MARLTDRQINGASPPSSSDQAAGAKAPTAASAPAPYAMSDLERTCHARDAVR